MNKNLKQITSFIASGLLLALFLVPVLLSAQGQGGGQNSGEGQGGGQNSTQIRLIEIGNPFNCDGVSPCTLKTLLEAIINKILLPIGGIVAAIMIIYAGFLYVTAGGNETQIKKAHDALLYGVIGAAILLGAWVISNAIAATIRQLGGQV